MLPNHQEPIRLFAYPNSPFSAKVYWALQYKRASFDLICVNPFSRQEVKFSGQGVVPVLQIGDAWLQDSTKSCIWLDEELAEQPLAGQSEQQRQMILDADRWVTDNLFALHFRACIAASDRQTTRRNALRMADVILASADSMPAWQKRIIRPVWPLMMRHLGFVKRAAHRLDANRPILSLLAEVQAGFEQRIQASGFIAETETPSFADIAAFAAIAFCTTYGFEETLNLSASPTIENWYQKMCGYFPDAPSPALFEHWPPVGFKR